MRWKNSLFITNCNEMKQTFIYSSVCYCIFLFPSRCSFVCSFVIRIICVYFRIHWKHWSRNVTTTPYYLLFTPKIVKRMKRNPTTALLDDQMRRVARNACLDGILLNELSFVNNFVMWVLQCIFRVFPQTYTHTYSNEYSCEIYSS